MKCYLLVTGNASQGMGYGNILLIALTLPFALDQQKYHAANHDSVTIFELETQTLSFREVENNAST